MPQKSYFSPMPIIKKYGEQIRTMGQDPHKERKNKLTIHELAKSRPNAEVPIQTNEPKGDETKPILTKPELSTDEQCKVSEPSDRPNNQHTESTGFDQSSRLGEHDAQQTKPKTKRSQKLELKKKQDG